MKALYLIADDDRAFIIVQTEIVQTEYGPERVIKRVARRLAKHKTLPCLNRPTRFPTTWKGLTIEELELSGFYCYPLGYPFKRYDLVNSLDPDNPLVARFTGHYTPSGFMEVKHVKDWPSEYWSVGQIHLVEAWTPFPEPIKSTDRKTNP